MARVVCYNVFMDYFDERETQTKAGDFDPEYLKQISANPHGPAAPEVPEPSTLDNLIEWFKSHLFPVIGVLLGVVLVIVAIATVNNMQRDKVEQVKNKTATVYLQVTGLKTATTDWQTEIKDVRLRAMGSELQSFLTAAEKEINDSAASTGANLNIIPSAVRSAERIRMQTLEDNLTKGKMNAQFDATYAREMVYQIDIILSTISDLTPRMDGAAHAVLLRSLVALQGNLRALQTRLEEFK